LVVLLLVLLLRCTLPLMLEQTKSTMPISVEGVTKNQRIQAL
jgi:hypothetical protein